MPPHPIQVSVFIVCRNERDFLGDCLNSVSRFHEIVIVDSGSTDGTLELIEDFRARGFPIRLFEREWPGFARQKQFAMDRCAGPWCLNLDADERLDEALIAAIAALDFDRSGVAGFSMRMTQYLPGYGYAPPAVHVKPQIRLFHKRRARYDLEQLLHEGLAYDGRIEAVGGGRVLHYRNLALGQDAGKAIAYATLKARQYHAAGRRAGLFGIALRPVGRFLKSYFLQRYFLCGAPGFIYSAMLGFYVFMAEAKLYRMGLGDSAPDE